MTDFPALRRLVRMFAGVALTGATMIVVGLVVGIVARDWPVASGLITGGMLALTVGIWARRKGQRIINGGGPDQS
jgi:hypothetical protein